MNKIVFIVLFAMLSNIALAESISNLLINSNYSEIIRPNGESKYVCTVFIEKNQLKILYESDAGENPGIFSYSINSNRIDLIIKSNWVINDWNWEDNHRPTTYYHINISFSENKVIYSCVELDHIEINNMIINQAIVNDDNVNIRDEASLNSLKIGKKYKGNSINVVGIGTVRNTIDKLDDYWYEIDEKGKKAWIFGAYINYQRFIEIN